MLKREDVKLVKAMPWYSNERSYAIKPRDENVVCAGLQEEHGFVWYKSGGLCPGWVHSLQEKTATGFTPGCGTRKAALEDFIKCYNAKHGE